MTPPPQPDPSALAAQFRAELGRLPVAYTQPIRVLRREYSRLLKGASADYVWDFAVALQPLLRRGTPERAGLLWVVCELIANHRPVFQILDEARLELLGGDMQSWDEVDAFARIVSGPAWLHRLIGDATIERWAHSPDLWWRRAALVSTVALNMRSQGGSGDTTRTLAVCEMLAADHEVMVQKAISWALRELIVHDAETVAAFIDAHEADLSAQTKREVRHKLATGLKSPRRSRSVAA